MACIRKKRNAHRILARKPKCKRLFLTSECIRENDIKTDVKETGRVDVDWIPLSQDKGFYEHGNEISRSVKRGKTLH